MIKNKLSRLLGLLTVCMTLHVSTAQAQKPIRKGMPPIQVQKSTGKALYTLAQLSGRWQEVKRTPVGANEPVEFSDSLLVKFDSNKVELKDASSMRMSMKGIAQVEAPNNLVAAGDEFIIRSLNKNLLVLDDGDHVRVFQKKDKFYYELVGKVKLNSELLDTAVHIDKKMLTGKWNVYRRQALAGSVDAGTRIIRSLEILPTATDTANGMVTWYMSDLTESSPCRIIFGNSGIRILTEKHVWEFNTYKGNGNEFVFGEAGKLVYYAKH